MASRRRLRTPQDLGAAVRDARIEAGLTQAQLAEHAGASREWILGLERGSRTRAELSKVLAVLHALDLPLYLEEPRNSGHEDDSSTTTSTDLEQALPSAARTASKIAQVNIRRLHDSGVERAARSITLPQVRVPALSTSVQRSMADAVQAADAQSERITTLLEPNRRMVQQMLQSLPRVPMPTVSPQLRALLESQNSPSRDVTGATGDESSPAGTDTQGEA